MLMRDSEGRKKQASSHIHVYNVQTTKQSNTTHPRQSLHVQYLWCRLAHSVNGEGSPVNTDTNTLWPLAQHQLVISVVALELQFQVISGGTERNSHN